MVRTVSQLESTTFLLLIGRARGFAGAAGATFRFRCTADASEVGSDPSRYRAYIVKSYFNVTDKRDVPESRRFAAAMASDPAAAAIFFSALMLTTAPIILDPVSPLDVAWAAVWILLLLVHVGFLATMRFAPARM